MMSSKEWLTIEDWLECSLPLCPVQIKHESRLERANLDTLHVCFSSCKLGGDVLGNGCSQVTEFSLHAVEIAKTMRGFSLEQRIFLER